MGDPTCCRVSGYVNLSPGPRPKRAPFFGSRSALAGICPVFLLPYEPRVWLQDPTQRHLRRYNH
ncbi:FAD-binding domain-containing protein [Colletotrichum scovillei]|nr:FAD-binding domain-containing protein [Colletotrichum scovillei]